MTKVTVVEEIMGANEQIADQNRRLLDEKGIVTVNLMASPGAGKTSLTVSTIEALRSQVRIGAIEGDTASQVDADRVATAGVPVVQINTGGGCHLDAPMVRHALEQLPLDEIDLLIIENVGNLICPVGFALGERVNVVIASVPEGDDKPYKYPGIFSAVDAVVINKTDLLPYLDFDVPAFRQLIAGLNPEARIFELSCKTGEGVEEWAEWLAGMCS
ncbi:MAG: hydrogenase nickel incorporation protein HypB [Chloroflexota bacterium]|nr:hydrogenase nickel incorporation protein HypB [Chloroflexota bacterium]